MHPRKTLGNPVIAYKPRRRSTLCATPSLGLAIIARALESPVTPFVPFVRIRGQKANAAVVFKCTWKGCLEIKATVPLIEEHVRQSHLGPKKSKVYENEDDDDISDHEEEFYYQEVAVDHMSSPPTMSHRDMARPPHEDPEYQKQLRLEAVPVNPSNTESNGATAMPCVKERNNAFTILQSPGTPIKHIKLSPRPFQAYHQQNMGLLTVSTGKIPSSPRRIRGETKKCRKVYGMEHRDLWCTQCKWKKACSRFGD
ncbi:hypothetical protein HZH68_000252 [Vespula germanica]|uniref:Zinc finger protein n=1 Tax=Vespula germanica TaxID=30212 RepID=A0A834NT82_VESGE|nr:hypothetical protein HZH68_000252 [Vespula germanica]